MEGLRQDLRRAVAAMRREPGFSFAVILTLALGIGGATAAFSFAHGVLVRGLPYAHGDRLVRLWEEHPGGVSPAGNRWLSSHTYVALRDRTRTLDGLGGYAVLELTVTFGEPTRVLAARVSPTVWTMLDAVPAHGRLFGPLDATRGAAPVVILSDELWRERFGADPAAVGRLLTVEGVPHRIVGIAGSGLAFPERGVRFWIPYVLTDAQGEHAETRVFTALGRLEAGATPEQVAAEATTIARSVTRGRLTEFFFGRGGAVVVHARPLLSDMTQSIRPALTIVAMASALVLLIAGANAASLVLSRGVARQRELAIRLALGSTRGRLVQQLVTEHVLLAGAGGALGLLLAWCVLRLVPVLAPERLPRLHEVGLDLTVVAYCVCATVLVALVASAWPAVRSASERYDALRELGTSSGAEFHSDRSQRLRHTLLAAEAAFAAILVVGASLLAHSFVRLLRVDAGYRAEGVITATITLPRTPGPGAATEFLDRVTPRLRALPAVIAVGASDMIPLMPRTAITEVALPPHVSGRKPTRGRTLVYTVTEGYAGALGLRLKQGRFVHARDRQLPRRAIVVNEEFVRQYLTARPVVGLTLAKLFGDDDRLRERDCRRRWQRPEERECRSRAAGDVPVCTMLPTGLSPAM